MTRRTVALLGPAFVAAMASVDPGNVAANLTAGATFGYLLVWSLVLACLMAMLVQYLSAKLGVVGAVLGLEDLGVEVLDILVILKVQEVLLL